MQSLSGTGSLLYKVEETEVWSYLYYLFVQLYV